ncbi:MAG TPA: hypothetical protein VMC61_01790 [Methanocella sp.]|nr:hypothetical protein [Methanocella sp.]
MSRPAKLIACALLAMALFSLMAPAHCHGTGARAYVPTQRSASADDFPFTYNGSFVVYNDGYRDGVYVIRVAVDEPTSINWLNLSEPAFTLRPGQSKLVYFTFNVTGEQAVPGEHDFIFTPTLLTTNVEPYLDTFASYISSADSFRFRLNVSGPRVTASTAVPVVFVNDGRTNLVQYSVLQDTNKVVTQLDRAVKLNVPDKAIVGEPVPISTSIFEGLSNRGISLMAVSPEGRVHAINEGNYTFDSVGLWGVIVLMGDEIIMGRTVDVVPIRSPLAGVDIGTALAGLSLLVLLSVVPLWLAAPRKAVADPYEDIVYKAYIIRKYIDKFDRYRLKRAVEMLNREYEGLVSKSALGKKAKARKAIEELNTLVSLEK